MNPSIWNLLPVAPPEHFETLAGYPRLIAQLLYNRGIKTPTEAQAFLDPEEGLTPDPLLLPQVDRAVQRIARALHTQERIAIFGDFDVDGVTGSAVLTEGLQALGARLLPYIPDRVAEGHGLNLPAIHHLHQQGVTLIVTADCGITSVGEVAAAADLGIDTVVTDHHTPPPVLPDAVAVVDPKLAAPDSPYAPLAAVGVAFTLLQALYASLDRPLDETLLELVALGTVADLAPMLGENRRLVRRGLAYLNRTRRLGLLELMRVSGLAPGQVDTEAIAYSLGPRINAPGRIDHANSSYRLLTAASTSEAELLARELEARNVERRQITRDILTQVREMLQQRAPGPVVILGEADFPAGVVGLVAGKLAEELYRPAVVYQLGPQESRGSCRSIPEFSIIEALRQCGDLFIRYGGHAQAAGFTIATEKLPILHRRLTAIAGEALAGKSLAPHITIDAEIKLERVKGDLLRALRELVPHGPQNPPPTFLARGLEIKDARSMGAEGQHRRLKLKAGGVTWSAVAFDVPNPGEPPPSPADVVFTLTADRWGGQNFLQMNVLAMAPAGAAPL